jgi:alkanesulfonate monooxygenase SsuD/methylene tetrahydromethanopterin reductase-like flavin-dependent oxidoreductase (luciferase family)
MKHRFCVYQYQNLPISALSERWRRSEDLGFDVLWNVDTVVDPDRPHGAMLDGPSTLVAMAMATRRIRIGTLVTSLYFRQPITAARAAMTIDQLSGGRLEIALGVGDPNAGPAAGGAPDLAPGERVARFREFVQLTDRLLTSPLTTFSGTYYSCVEAEMIPGPVQRPRPPITIAAHGPRMLAIAAEWADGWSSWGGYGIETEAEFHSLTADRSRRFDDMCLDRGRDPGTIRHSVVCFPPLTPWESVDYFEDLVGRYGEMGIDEFVLYWPQNWRDRPQEDDVFERIALDVLPRLRATTSVVERAIEELPASAEAAKLERVDEVPD